MIVYLAGGFFMLIGLGLFFARDFVWEMEAAGKQMQGYAVERTELWEFGATLRGILLIGTGIVLILIGVVIGGQDRQGNSERDHLQATFGNAIAQWQKNVSRGEIGTFYTDEWEGAEEVVYGRCGYAHFGVIIHDYEESDYLYTQADRIIECRLDGTGFWMSDDLGDGWYRGTALSGS